MKRLIYWREWVGWISGITSWSRSWNHTQSHLTSLTICVGSSVALHGREEKKVVFLLSIELRERWRNFRFSDLVKTRARERKHKLITSIECETNGIFSPSPFHYRLPDAGEHHLKVPTALHIGPEDGHQTTWRRRIGWEALEANGKMCSKHISTARRSIVRPTTIQLAWKRFH